MKKLLTIAILLMACTAGAQNLDAILQAVERNNTSLAALRSDNYATVEQLNSEASIVGPTSVEYSPFFGGSSSGLASSELIVSQEFDFPTLGTMRRNSNQAQQRVLDLQYQQLRRDVLLEAKKLCYDLSSAVQTRNLLRLREHNSDSLLAAYETSMQRGNATIIDVNRIKMDRMAVHTQLVQTQGEVNTLLTQLQSLNGGQPIDWSQDLILECERLASVDGITLEESVAQAAFDATRHDIKLAEKSWLPSLTVGYRRNTEMREATNGFVVGVSMPLFSRSGKVKAARARQVAAQVQIDNARNEAQSRTRALMTEVQQLQATIDSYDMPLMQQTLALINRAISKGALTIPEYYNQTDRIYAAMQELIELENRYNKLMCDLNRDAM